LKKLTAIDKDCDQYAEDAQKMNSFLKKSLLTLNESLNATSVEDVTNMQTINSKIEKEYNTIQTLFTEIKSTHSRIIKSGGDANVYTKLTIDGLSKLNKEVSEKLKQQTDELKKEIIKQQEYEKISFRI